MRVRGAAVAVGTSHRYQAWPRAGTGDCHVQLQMLSCWAVYLPPYYQLRCGHSLTDRMTCPMAAPGPCAGAQPDPADQP